MVCRYRYRTFFLLFMLTISHLVAVASSSNDMHIVFVIWYSIVVRYASIFLDVAFRFFLKWTLNAHTYTSLNSFATLYVLYRLLYSFFRFACKLLRRHSQFFCFHSHYKLFVCYSCCCQSHCYCYYGCYYILILTLNFRCASLFRSLSFSVPLTLSVFFPPLSFSPFLSTSNRFTIWFPKYLLIFEIIFLHEIELHESN